MVVASRWRAEAQLRVIILADGGKGQKGHEVVLTPTAAPWPGVGRRFRRETHRNQRGLGRASLPPRPANGFPSSVLPFVV